MRVPLGIDVAQRRVAEGIEHVFDGAVLAKHAHVQDVVHCAVSARVRVAVPVRQGPLYGVGDLRMERLPDPVNLRCERTYPSSATATYTWRPYGPSE